jgi:RNA polymerase sigma-70 factor (ECF subfamily)
MGISSHEVDDVAQEVYLQLYRNFDKMPAEVAPERWLKGIARNLCLNHIRTRARKGRLHREALLELLARTEAPADGWSDADAVREMLATCCEKLPGRSRRLLKLRYEQDMSSSGIAAAINSTAEAVRVALHRIRAILRDCVSQNLAAEP